LKNDFHQFKLEFTKEKEMADFRKWFLVLAVLAIVAVPVSAQTPFTCSATPGSTPTIRDAGLTELVGDVVLTCSGGTAGSNITTNFQIFMSPTQVTNKVKKGVTATECPTGINCVTDALAKVTDLNGLPVAQVNQPADASVAGLVVGLLQSNLAAGDTPTSRNSILFPAISLPQGTTSFIRITNVRVFAPPVSNIAIPTQVFEFISTNPAGVVPIANSTLVVAFVQPGMQFTARNAADTAAASLSFSQCITQASGNTDFIAKFTEGFPLAFKTVEQETGTVAAVQAIGGTVMPDPTASNPTELLVRFSNIPAGVRIFVTSTQVATGTSAGITAELVSPEGTGSVEVPITSGSGSATWAILTNDPAASSAQKSIAFGVDIAFESNTSAGLPGLTGSTPGSVSGTFAPVSTVNSASTSADIPRFRDNPTGASVFSIIPCVTNLLFPFISNQAGFDTGIALVNTSADNAGNKLPFNTSTQHGTCTVFYFNGTTTAPAPQVTPDIVAGGMFAFTLQGGGVPGSTGSAAGFQGYAIARCNFLFAHGFAFISDRNTPSLGSQGYLALVIPDRARVPDPFSTAGSGSGEQLVQ
jgi:hypothetical protein